MQRLAVVDERARVAHPRAWRHVWVAAACNLGCEFCVKQRTDVPPAGEELGAGAVVVSGGEPLLTPGILARLRAASGPVALETNAALLHSLANVRRLKAAGVSEVRMFLPGWDRASTDQIARVTGIGELQEQAARNVVAVGLELSLVVPVTEQHREQLLEYLQRAECLSESRGDDAGPLRVQLAWALAAGALPSAELERALARMALAAVRRGIVLHFDGPLAPAACVFDRPEAFASLFAGPTERRELPPACAACPIRDACYGPRSDQTPRPLVPAGRHELAYRSAMRTLSDAADVHDWVRSGDARRWGRENFVSIGSEPDLRSGGAVTSALIRPFFHCNQDCRFCWVDLDQARVPDAMIGQALSAMALEGMKALSITGGEPTLDKRLPDQIRLARALGVEQVTLQTNAVRLERRELASVLAGAGLTRAFVSLHAAEASVSDSITRAPDTFDRTVRGIRNLLELGVSVGIGVVFTNDNRDQARRIVELLAGPLRGADLTLSVAAAVNDRVDARQVAPRYSTLAPSLREAAHAAHELGIAYAGLLGQCGLPPCILDGDPICFPEFGSGLREWSAPQDFVHAPVCDGCSMRRLCPGVRASYAAAHGTDELHAI